jgi:hypothetical protein
LKLRRGVNLVCDPAFLLHGFRPVEVRRVLIPEGNTGKVRKLGIPTKAA